MTSIIIIEDHLLVRESLKDTLLAYKDYKVVAESDDIEEGYNKITELKPAIILLDINIKGQSSVDLIRKITNTIPNPKIIIVSMNNEHSFIKKMFSFGVKGYVTKHSPKNDLIESIEKVAAGETYFCTEVKKILLGDVKDRGPELSYRELEIIKLVCKGLSNKEIALSLDVSIKGIEAHKTKIYKKLQIKSSGELILYANSRGIA